MEGALLNLPKEDGELIIISHLFLLSSCQNQSFLTSCRFKQMTKFSAVNLNEILFKSNFETYFPSIRRCVLITRFNDQDGVSCRGNNPIQQQD